MIRHRFSEKTKYRTCRVVSCLLGLVRFISFSLGFFYHFQIPTLFVLSSSIIRFLVYFGVCQERSQVSLCIFLAEHKLAVFGTEGGNWADIVLIFLFSGQRSVVATWTNPLFIYKISYIAVTFYLLFAAAGVIFCLVNAVINLLLFCNQNKV